MQTRTAVADLRSSDQRRAIVKTGGRRRTTSALRDVLVNLAVLVRPRAKTLDRRHYHARIQLLDTFPGEAHAIQRTGGEILDQYIALLDQRIENFLALRILGIKRDRTLVVVQHGEVQTVHIGDVAQLAACGIAFAGAFNFYDVRTHPSQKLGTRRPRLN